MGLNEYLGYMAAFIFVLALMGLFFWGLKYLVLKGNVIFPQHVAPRIGIVASLGIDGRRRLFLIRRDGVEHLLLTGGPNDLVIETGIEIPDKDTEEVRDDE